MSEEISLKGAVGVYSVLFGFFGSILGGIIGENKYPALFKGGGIGALVGVVVGACVYGHKKHLSEQKIILKLKNIQESQNIPELQNIPKPPPNSNVYEHWEIENNKECYWANIEDYFERYLNHVSFPRIERMRERIKNNLPITPIDILRRDGYINGVANGYHRLKVLSEFGYTHVLVYKA